MRVEARGRTATGGLLDALAGGWQVAGPRGAVAIGSLSIWLLPYATQARIQTDIHATVLSLVLSITHTCIPGTHTRTQPSRHPSRPPGDVRNSRRLPLMGWGLGPVGKRGKSHTHNMFGFGFRSVG